MRSDSPAERLGTDGQSYGTLAVVTTAVLGTVLAAVFLFDVAVPERGIGLFEGLSPSVGTGAGFAIWGLITQLGDPWFLLLLAALVYLLGVDRSLAERPRDGAFVLAVLFAAFSFVDLLKHLFAAPRPPGAGTVTVPVWLPDALGGTFQSITTGTGYAFPSGHALGTTAVFAALASQMRVGTPRLRWAAAGVGVLLVAASRVVIGVHFLVDVGVGIVAGASLFAVAAALGEERPLRVFALGVTIGALAVVATALAASGDVWKAGQWFGASVGGGLAWYLVRPGDTLGRRGTLVAGTPIAVLWAVVYVTAPPLVVTVGATALAAGLIVSAPTLAQRFTTAS